MSLYRTEFAGGGHARRIDLNHPWTVYDETGTAVLSVDALSDVPGVRAAWAAYSTGVRIGFARGRAYERATEPLRKCFEPGNDPSGGAVPPSGLTP